MSPITFVLLRAASGPLDELQAAASGMPVGKLDVFLNAAEIGDFLAHAGSRSTVWSQFVDNSSTMPAAFQISAPRSTARPRRYGTTTIEAGRARLRPEGKSVHRDQRRVLLAATASKGGIRFGPFALHTPHFQMSR